MSFYTSINKKRILFVKRTFVCFANGTILRNRGNMILFGHLYYCFLFSCYFSLLCSWLLQAFSGKQMAGAMTYNFIKAIKENPKITYGGLLISMHTAIKEGKETGCLNLKRLFRRKILQVVSFSFLFTFQHGMRNYM